MDYKALLLKYMQHVLLNEGITFVEHSDLYEAGAFTEVEWQELHVMSRSLGSGDLTADTSGEELTT